MCTLIVQNCKTVAPCTDPDSIARFSAYSNETLLSDARQECGATLDAISGAVRFCSLPLLRAGVSFACYGRVHRRSHQLTDK